jgi:ribonuclease G
LAEWLFEDGIGEARAALVEDGRILKARIETEGSGPRVGTVVEARMTKIVVPGQTVHIMLEGGGEAMLQGIPPGLGLGKAFLVRIVREAIPEQGRPKLPKAVPAGPAFEKGPGPTLLDRIVATDIPVHRCQPHEPDALEEAGWSEVLDEAERGELVFPGGALRMFLTPAMTLFDVDGSIPAADLAMQAAPAICAAIVRLGIGGSTGVDFPTLPDRDTRKALDALMDVHMPLPFERTAINGFGFMQIVRPRLRASLPELLLSDPAAAALRSALRRLERDPPPLGQALDLPKAQKDYLAAHPEWLAQLSQRTGRAIAMPS